MNNDLFSYNYYFKITNDNHLSLIDKDSIYDYKDFIYSDKNDIRLYELYYLIYYDNLNNVEIRIEIRNINKSLFKDCTYGFYPVFVFKIDKMKTVLDKLQLLLTDKHKNEDVQKIKEYAYYNIIFNYII